MVCRSPPEHSITKGVTDVDTFLKILPYAVNLLSGILLACATYTINKARKNHEEEKEEAEKKEKALADGVQALLRESVVGNYNRYSDRGYCPIYAKESIKKVYKSYEALGGNDVAHDLYDKILKMPTELKEEESHE